MLIKDSFLTVGKFFWFFPNPVERHRYLYGKRWGWFLLSFAVIAVCIFSLWILGLSLGGEELLGESDDGRNKSLEIWGIISQFADPGNIHMAKSGWAAIIAVISAFSGVICLSGLMISSLVNFISQRGEAWRKGHIIYNGFWGRLFFKDYVVIIGVNEQTATIVKSALRKVDYVLIQTRRDVEKAKMRINLRLDEEEEKRIVYYHGERTSNDDINNLRLKNAEEVYVLGEDMHYENEEDHDAFNMSCLEHIAKYIQNNPLDDKKGQLKCHVNFEFQSTFMAFKFTHIYRNINDKVEFIPFNVHDIWAKKVLVDNYAIVPSCKEPEKYYPLDAYWAKDYETDTNELEFINQDSDQTVHLIVMGMNQMGVALAMQTALLVHLPNYQTDTNRRTTITFIDENAIREGEYLRSRYDALFSLCRYRSIVSNKTAFNQNKKDYITSWTDPMIKGRYAYMGHNFMDLQWEFIEGNVASPEIRCYISALAENVKNKTCTFAVCFNNPQQSIATALYLPEVVLKRALQILVYQQNSFDMINKVATTEKDWKRYRRLKPFGMIEGCYSGGSFDNKLAKFINMLYVDGVPTDLQLKKKTALIERATQLWDKLGIVDKYANIDLVDSFDMKLRALGVNEEEQRLALKEEGRVKALAKAEHLRWVTERLTMGYRPLDQDELASLQNEGQSGYKHSKEYYKRKSRAHLDICSYEALENGRDKAAMEKNMDERIINMIITLRGLESRKETKV